MITAAIVIYLVSAGACWMYMHRAFSKNGTYRNTNPNLLDFLVVVSPLLNTIFSILCISKVPYAKLGNPTFNWFFGIKKK